MYDYLVIVPTVVSKDIILSAFVSFIRNADEKTLLAFSFNPIDFPEAEKIASALENIYQAEISLSRVKKNVDYKIIWSDKPIGFSGAINKAYSVLKNEMELPEYIICCQDDIKVANNWQSRLCNHFKNPKLTSRSNASFNLVQGSPARPIEGLDDKIGVIVPRTNGAYNAQRYSSDALQKFSAFKNDINAIQKYIESSIPNFTVVYTAFESFCFAIKKDVAEKMEGDFPYGGFLDAGMSKIAGYENMDLAKRLYEEGFLSCIAYDCYVHHTQHATLDKHFKDIDRGRINKLNFYLKHRKDKEEIGNVIGAYRVSFKCVNDLIQFKLSLSKSFNIIEGAAVLFTSNPADVLSSYDKKLYNQLEESDRVYLEQCANADTVEKLKAYTENWIDLIKSRSKKENFITTIDFWEGQFNERDERNRTHEMAESINADWIISIDSDEFFEDRITREKFRRILKHPDPSCIVGHTGWINHWETTQLVRNDAPFNQGYVSGQSGPRVWKVNPNLKIRIAGGSEIGLHCGNAPELSAENNYTTSIRFRHLSHVRAIDRFAKTQFYTNVDKEKNPALVGNKDYRHIMKQESIPVSLYNAKNGIALSMLAYSKENYNDYMQMWDQLYGVVDRIVLGWTETWNDEDKAWLDLSIDEILELQEWYSTGPSKEFALAIKLYSVDVIDCALDNTTGLSGCRNKTFDKIESENDGYISWILFLDPDEFCSRPDLFPTTIRRMAEINDCWGWSFKFDNLINDMTDAAHSESIRMFRIDGRGSMRMNGRVHEGFDISLKKLHLNGVHPNIQISPLKFVNKGLNLTGDRLSDKLAKYRDLLLEELTHNSLDAGSWTALGLQLVNDGYTEKAKICFERACMCGGTAYMPFREMGSLLLRDAKAYFAKAHSRIPKSHPNHQTSAHIMKVLSEIAPDPKILQTNQDLSSNLTLPQFPYDRIILDDFGEFMILPEEEDLDGVQD